MSMLGADIQELSIQAERVSPDILRCKIGAPGRWEVPRKVFKASNITGRAAAEVSCCPILALWLLFLLAGPSLAFRCYCYNQEICHGF